MRNSHKRNGRKSGASGLVRTGADIEVMPLVSLTPAKINNSIYKPVELDDPQVRALARNIREKGLLEPLVITLDDVILSGHRRRAACVLADVFEVRVRRHPIWSTDPDFPAVLVAFNEQRIKSIDEQIREAVINTDKDSAYASLIAYRKAQSLKSLGQADDAGLHLVATRSARKRSRISDAKMLMLDAVVAVLEHYRDYLPFTLRTIHYRLLNNPPLRNANDCTSWYANDRKSYADLSDLLTRARLSGRVPWSSLHDPTRPTESWQSWPNPAVFLREQLDNFLRDYRRDPLQSQSVYVEVIAEKLTVATAVERATGEFGVPYCVGRGFSSADLRHQLDRRFRRSGKDAMTVLLLSDFDPEGESIAETFAASMRDEFDVPITAYKVALAHQQVSDLGLPPGGIAKKKSSRTKAFVAKYGPSVYELEALEPDALEDMVRNAITGVIDMDLFRREREREADDAAELDAARQRALVALGNFRTSPDGGVA